MSFGFSVGDFLTAVKLAHQLVVALKDGRGSGSKFQAVVQELDSFDRAMIEVKNLQAPAELEPRLCMIQQAASHCQAAIDNFFRDNETYRQCLGQGGSTKWWKDALYKVKWAVHKADDVAELRACLHEHATTLGIMLQLLQIDFIKFTITRMESSVQSQTESNRSSLEQLASSLQARLTQEITNSTLELTTNQTQSDSDLRRLMAQTLQATTEVHQMVFQAQTGVPGQVPREEPVYLEDARGVLAPFHLEFVTSAEILIYALKQRFSESGARKVEQKKFVIIDANTFRDIDLTRDWKRCFRPGQQVNMSIDFNTFTKSTACPGCLEECAGAQDEQMKCSNCGMSFRRIETFKAKNVGSFNNPEEQACTDSSDRSETYSEAGDSSDEESDHATSPSQDKENEASDDEISEYKRVRLLDDGRIRWDPSACAQGLRINKTGLGVTFAGRETSVDPTAFAFVRSTRPENAMATSRKIYFEVEVQRGDVCVGFCIDGRPSVATFGTDGVYAYCGNDGKVVKSAKRPQVAGPSTSPGDIVGCGLFGRKGYFGLNGRLVCRFEINRKHRRSSFYPVVGLKKGASVMANFRARTFLTKKIPKAIMDTSVGNSLPVPTVVTREFWVCCQCGDIADSFTSVQCVSCHHGFDTGHCFKETV